MGRRKKEDLTNVAQDLTKTDKVADLADKVAQEVATNIVSQEEADAFVKSRFKNDISIPVHEDLPKGFTRIENQIFVDTIVKIDHLGNEFTDRVKLKDIISITHQRYVNDMLSINPIVMTEKFWIVHRGRYVCNIITREIFEELVKLLPSKVEYHYIDLAANRFTYRFTVSSWPTQEDLSTQVKQYNNEIKQALS